MDILFLILVNFDCLLTGQRTDATGFYRFNSLSVKSMVIRVKKKVDSSQN
jgi:hypothetical protein